MKNDQISFNYTNSLIEFLNQTNSSILISTYQSEKVIIIGSYCNSLDIRYHNFKRPMGMCKDTIGLWMGIGNSIYKFNPHQNIKINDKVYKHCFLPTDIHITGDIDIHEMQAGKELYFVNTKFSCICVKDNISSFKPIWKPSFITTLQPVDKCHLNGFCLKNNKPKYATTLGKSDHPLGWRENKTNGGLLIDIENNEILLDGLSMPHSPRWYKDKLWFLESGKGTLSFYDFNKKTSKTIAKIPGFTRGIDFIDNFALIGISKVRESITFSGLPITKLEKRVSGVWIVNIKNGNIVAFIEFTEGIDEIFAVTVIHDSPITILDIDSKLLDNNYIVNKTNLGKIKMPETPIEIATPFFERGNDLFNDNKKEEAIKEYKKALKIQPDHLPAIFNMAIALGDLGKFDEAIKLLLETKQKDASIAEIYNSLGFIYYKKGNYNLAKKNFEKAIEINPNYIQAKNSLKALKKEMLSK